MVTSVGKLFADLTQHRSPGKIAIGVTLGTSLGFLPIDNLVWVLLLVALLFLPVHQLSAVAAWLATSLLSSQLSAIPNSLGAWLLSLDGVRWCVVQSHAIPWSAWLRLNNTLVLGSLALGVVLLAPNWIALRLLAGRPKRQGSHPLDELAHIATPYRKSVSTSSRPRTPSDPNPPGTLTSAAPLTSPPSPTASPTPKSVLRVDPPHTHLESESTDADERMEQVTLRETFIEVVRLRAPQPHHFSPTNDRPDAMLLETHTSTPSLPASSMESPQVESPAGNSVDSVVTRFSPAHHQLSGPKSSSSLRFLLRHLKSNRRSEDHAETQA